MPIFSLFEPGGQLDLTQPAWQAQRSQSNKSEPKINRTQSNPVGRIVVRLVRQSNIIELELFGEFDFPLIIEGVRLPNSIDAITLFFFIRMLFSRARLNILIFPPILGCKYSCIILNNSL